MGSLQHFHSFCCTLCEVFGKHVTSETNGRLTTTPRTEVAVIAAGRSPARKSLRKTAKPPILMHLSR